MDVLLRRATSITFFAKVIVAESDADFCAEYFDPPDVAYGSYAECVDAGEDEAVCADYFEPPREKYPRDIPPSSEEYPSDDACVDNLRGIWRFRARSEGRRMGESNVWVGVKRYFVNATIQTNGDHEVHASTCLRLPRSHRRYLGDFASCFPAVMEARKRYTRVNGCSDCASACHTGYPVDSPPLG
jgi:hypothetical protein